MNDDRLKNRQSRNQPEMPSYFRRDRVGRDGFLSQMGPFSEEDRALFSRLCDMWEPGLLYDKFLTKVGNEYLNIDAALHSLMTHLEKNNCGLILRTLEDGILKKNRIILTDRNSPRFWYWLVENLWQTCRISDRTPFPTVEDLRQRKGFSQGLVHDFSLTEISRSFIDAHAEEVIIYALSDFNGKKLIATPATLPFLMEVSRQKIRAILADSSLQSDLARFTETVVSSLQESLTHNDEKLWNKLSEVITVHRKDLLAKKGNIPNDFFVAAGILKIFTQNELKEVQRLREEDARKRETMEDILANLIQQSHVPIPAAEFNKQFELYKDRWPDLKEMFITHYMKSTGRKGLPVVVPLGEDFVYRNHLYPFFRVRHKAAAAELREYYLDMIEHILRTNNRDHITVFTSIDAFRRDIAAHLASEFPLLKELLSRPQIVSEGIIHHASNTLKITNMEKVEPLLARYFNSNSMGFHPPEKLFGLSLRLMFYDAFHRISWIRRIILKLFGRFDSYIRALSTHTPLEEPRSLRQPSPPDEQARGEWNYEKDHGPSKRVIKGGARRRTQSEVKMKRYSVKQQDEAWDEFQSVFKNKGK